MENIFTQMQNVRHTLTPNIRDLLDSVFALRGRQWDQGSPVPSSSTSHIQNGYTNPPNVEYPVFYPSDLSIEEQDFLASCEDEYDYFL